MQREEKKCIYDKAVLRVGKGWGKGGGLVCFGNNVFITNKLYS